MGCYNYSNGLFEIQVKLPKKLGTYNPSVFQCTISVICTLCLKMQFNILHHRVPIITEYEKLN